MNTSQLESVAQALVRKGRGILAADESTTSANKRFAAVNVEQTPENRRIYRELLFTTPQAKEALSGIIFYDETFWQVGESGKPLREIVAEMGIILGIKVDEGLLDLPGFSGEKITKGLDALPERMALYREKGAQFAKWRAVVEIGEGIPTDECIKANMFVLARYARICQEYDIVPIVEPEVLFDGTYTIDECEAVMNRVYDELFSAMTRYRVHIRGAILKTSMVLPGKMSGSPMDPTQIAERTVRTLHTHVPHDLGGVVFLSGGQIPAQAFLNLSAIVAHGPHPWGVTFSYSRALQDPVLKYWAANRDDVIGAQHVFAEQLHIAVEAAKGELSSGAVGDSFVSASQDM